MDAINSQPASGYQLRQHEIDGLRQRGLRPIPFDVCAVHVQDFAPVDALGKPLAIGGLEVGNFTGTAQTEGA